jgi:hypothetical protein
MNNEDHMGPSIANHEFKINHHPHVRLHSANNTSKRKVMNS